MREYDVESEPVALVAFLFVIELLVLNWCPSFNGLHSVRVAGTHMYPFMCFFKY